MSRMPKAGHYLVLRCWEGCQGSQTGKTNYISALNSKGDRRTGGLVCIGKNKRMKEERHRFRVAYHIKRRIKWTSGITSVAQFTLPTGTLANHSTGLRRGSANDCCRHQRRFIKSLGPVNQTLERIDVDGEHGRLCWRLRLSPLA